MAAPLESNPFATRYTRPGAITYQFSLESRSDLPPFGAACFSPFESVSDVPSGADPAACEIIGRLKAYQGNLIIGPHGSGKTTLLHSLLDSLRCCRPVHVLWHGCFEKLAVGVQPWKGFSAAQVRSHLRHELHLLKVSVLSTPLLRWDAQSCAAGTRAQHIWHA